MHGKETMVGIYCMREENIFNNKKTNKYHIPDLMKRHLFIDTGVKKEDDP